MNFSQSFRLAIKSLMTSKMRALLTMLGIIIGVAAVIIITSLGNGMEVMMNEQFEKLGANLIQVQIMDYGTSSRSVSPDDMKELVEKYNDHLIRLPMRQGLRSLNLSNAVAVTVYEAFRQHDFQGLK